MFCIRPFAACNDVYAMMLLRCTWGLLVVAVAVTCCAVLLMLCAHMLCCSACWGELSVCHSRVLPILTQVLGVVRTL